MDWVFWRKIKFVHFVYCLLFLACALQLFYYGFFYVRILFVKHIDEVKQLSTHTRTVSVIVCAHNEIENLKRLIPALLQQEYQYFELIIADDRSTDGSFEFFENLYKNDNRFRIIRIEGNTEGVNPKKFTLSKAIQLSKNELILLTDADCMPASKDWVTLMVSALGNNKEIVLGYSPYEYRKGWLNLLIRFETVYTAIQYFSFALAGVPYMGVGRNLLYKKTLFENNGGFGTHSKVMGGDDDLFIKDVATSNNVGVCFAKNAWMWSIPKENYVTWLKQKRRHLSVGTKYTLKHKILLALQLFSQIMFHFAVLLLFYKDYKYAFAFLMIRGLVFVVIFALIARKLGDNYKWSWLLLPIEVVYIFNYLVIVISLAIYKKIKWS